MSQPNRPGRSPVKVAKPLTKEQRAEAEKANAANTAEVNRSIDEWRAMQGLPPRTGGTDGK